MLGGVPGNDEEGVMWRHRGEDIGPLIADLAGKGNELIYVNDLKDSGREANVVFSEFVHDGWPYLFVVTKKPIAEGEELLVDYGKAHWEGHLPSASNLHLDPTT